MKLNRVYYKHLRKSIFLVVAGLGFLMYEGYPNGQQNDNFFILVMVVLSAFFGFIGIIMLFARYDKGIKFRRKFAYCFFGVANCAIGLISMPFSILHRAGILSILIYILGFLIGAVILIDIFFGKRTIRHETEVLIS
ncbi:MAG TPA: hypothetical protein VNV85_16570 [Puia sp.]|nr:hypothetical protein [Puia sp.]